MVTEAQKVLVDQGVISVDPDGTIRLTRDAWQNATIGTRYEERGSLHFVRFKDDRYSIAVRTFGRPDFIHRFWDHRAIAEVMPGDWVIFADGDETQSVHVYSYDDSAFF